MCLFFRSPDLARPEVLLLEAPLVAVGFIVVQVLAHHLVFWFKQEVAEGAGHRLPAVVHWTGNEDRFHVSEGESVAGRKLTLVVGVLEVVVNVGHKVLHKMAPDVWHQGVVTLEFAAQHVQGDVWR